MLTFWMLGYGGFISTIIYPILTNGEGVGGVLLDIVCYPGDDELSLGCLAF